MEERKKKKKFCEGFLSHQIFGSFSLSFFFIFSEERKRRESVCCFCLVFLLVRQTKQKEGWKKKLSFASSQERESERDDHHHFIIIMAQGGGHGGGGGGNGVKKKNDDVDLVSNDEQRKSSHSLRESLRKTTNFSTILVASLHDDDDETKRTFFKAPSSLTSAIGDAQEKQQITSENEEPKVKNKQDYLQDEMQPWVKPVGASLADPEQGPFIAWCEEHFREVTTEDAKKLIPSTSQPKLEEDPDFLTLPGKERSYHEE